MLAASAVAAAFVSDWFVAALEPAMHAFGISEAFAGLVIVAIAGNAIENVVGIQLAARTDPSTPSRSSSTRPCRSPSSWRRSW